jgi:ATP-dependent DNA helicase RecQ
MSTSSALSAPSAASAPAEQWNPPCVCIDIETPATGEAVLHKLAAFRPDTGARVSFQGKFSPAEVKRELDALATGAEFVLGHKVRRHDLPVLAQLYPGLALANLPVIDTLELSPLAFPENPYHRLVKDYKLVSDARNHPLRDAELSLQLFREELQAFEALCRDRPDEIGLFHFLLGAAPGGVGSLFTLVRRAPCPSLQAAAGHLAKAVDGNVCATRALMNGSFISDVCEMPVP